MTGLEETHLLYKTMELCAFQTRAEWETQVSIYKSLIVRLQEGIPNHLTKKLALFTIKVMVAEEIHMCWKIMGVLERPITIDKMVIMFSETPWEVIERVQLSIFKIQFMTKEILQLILIGSLRKGNIRMQNMQEFKMH